MTIGTLGIVGGGAWGTALAEAACRAGRQVVLVARDGAVVDEINRLHTNTRYLPGVTLDPRLEATADLARAAAADAILLVVPAQSTRQVAADLRPLVQPRQPIVVCAKGIELSTGRLLADVVNETVPAAVPAMLSGPGFAADVVAGLPTAVTLACADDAVGRALAIALGSATFRPYWSDDMIGVQMGGALKNVLAIAAGIVAGRGLGLSAQAALVTRGFAELRRFAEAHGARPETLMGLSGLGDLVLTCSGPKSRNFALGLAVADPAGHGSARQMTTEGVMTATAVVDIARLRRIDMPIASAVVAILDKKLSIDDAMAALLQRPLKAED